MKHAVRRVQGDKGNIIGFGVFRRWNVAALPETAIINVQHCSDPDDLRPLREQHKAYRLLGIWPSQRQADRMASTFNEQTRAVR